MVGGSVGGMGGVQQAVFNWLKDQDAPRLAEEIGVALGLDEKQSANACTNLSRKGLILGETTNGNKKSWWVAPGAVFTGRGGEKTGDTMPRVPRTKRVLSTHPGVLRLRAAMDELMEAFIKIEGNIVSDSDLRALEQVRAVAKQLAPRDIES